KNKKTKIKKEVYKMDENEHDKKPIDLENHVQELPDDRASGKTIDDFHEETSSELVDHDVQDVEINAEESDDVDIKSIYGWSAIALSVLSFFIVPFLFALLGIIVGFVARYNRALILGNTAIVIGALSIIVRLFILPLI